jgi:hypothetical protein
MGRRRSDALLERIMDKTQATMFERVGRLFRRSRRCSFCGKPAEAIEQLVAGANAYICGDCVVKCVSVLEDRGGLAPSAPGH